MRNTVVGKYNGEIGRKIQFDLSMTGLVLHAVLHDPKNIHLLNHNSTDKFLKHVGTNVYIIALNTRNVLVT